MKDKVMKIFGDPLMTDDNEGVRQVKSESDVFYSKSKQTNSKRTEPSNEDVLFNTQQQGRGNKGNRGGFRSNRGRGNGRDRRGGGGNVSGWSDDR